jgi:hypothetical protein
VSTAKKVAAIIERCDQGRMDHNGGYYSQYVIENGKVYWADYDPGKEYNAVTLTVTPVKKFISEHAWVFEDDDAEAA